MGNRTWHEEHFNCIKCKNNVFNMKYMQVDDEPMCSKCWKETRPPVSTTKRNSTFILG